MKKIILALSLVSILFLTGCEKNRVSSETSSLTTAYRAKMDKGETTPEQDKAFIRAMEEVVYQLDRANRGKKKADETRRMAKMIVEGNDPREVFKLDDSK